MKKSLGKFLLPIVLVSIICFVFESCNNDDTPNPKSKIENQNIQSATAKDEMISFEDPTGEIKAFYNQLKPFDLSTFKSCFADLAHQNPNAKSYQFWGTGSDNRVYRWNGSIWTEPNPAARLAYVEVSSYGSGTSTSSTGVWGIGPDNRVYNWNGSYWTEPNPAARLYAIAPWDNTRALGIGSEGTLYITNNGGASWSLFGTKKWFVSISVGNSFNIWGITADNNQLPSKLWQYNIYTYGWDYKVTPVYPLRAAAMFTDGVYFFENTAGARKIYRSFDGINFTQPNPAAALYRSISAAGNDIVCGIGSSNTPYASYNSGASWNYLNSQAQLSRISVGYE